MSSYSLERRAQRGTTRYVVSPTVRQRYAKPNTWRLWGVAFVVAVVLGAMPFVIARGLVQALWGGL